MNFLYYKLRKKNIILNQWKNLKKKLKSIIICNDIYHKKL